MTGCLAGESVAGGADEFLHERDSGDNHTLITSTRCQGCNTGPKQQCALVGPGFSALDRIGPLSRARLPADTRTPRRRDTSIIASASSSIRCAFFFGKFGGGPSKLKKPKRQPVSEGPQTSEGKARPAGHTAVQAQARLAPDQALSVRRNNAPNQIGTGPPRQSRFRGQCP